MDQLHVVVTTDDHVTVVAPDNAHENYLVELRRSRHGAVSDRYEPRGQLFNAFFATATVVDMLTVDPGSRRARAPSAQHAVVPGERAEPSCGAFS